MSEALQKTDYVIMDKADEQQIISADDDLRKALVYEVRGTKQVTFIGLKYLVLKMSQSGQPLTIIKSEITLDKDDPDNQSMWYWRSLVRVRNEKTHLETEGISESPYLESTKYDKFGKTKSLSKAERNAWRKQIPELEIITLLKNANGQRTEKLNASEFKAGTLDKICTCEEPCFGKASGMCLKCGGGRNQNESQTFCKTQSWKLSKL